MFRTRTSPARPTFRPRLEALEDRTVFATLQRGFSEVLLGSGLTRPTAFEILPDGRFLICQQDGALRVFNGSQLLSTPALTLSVNSEGERGLLGVAVDPSFVRNRFIYLYYTVPGTSIHNRVSRFTLGDNNLVVGGSEVPILNLDPVQSRVHNGGAIHFGTDGRLYVAVGDDARASIDPMAIDSRFGKILRINPNGSIPADNPFYNTAVGDNRAIWATGLRNPYTFAVQPGFGRIFINDVGQATWEEINVGAPGANYGWRASEGPTSDPRFDSPIYAYNHGSGPFKGNAIVGGAFYNPATTRFPREYGGTYFFSDLTGGWINNLNPRTRAVTRFAVGITAPVDLKVSTSGYLYYLARGADTDTGVFVGIRFNAVDLRWNGGGVGGPSSVRAGAGFRLTRQYSIAGSAFVSNFEIRYVASQDAVIGNADDVFLVRETLVAASTKTPGQHPGASPPVSLPRAGRWYVFAILDWTGNIPEVYEGNNIVRSVSQIVAT